MIKVQNNPIKIWTHHLIIDNNEKKGDKSILSKNQIELQNVKTSRRSEYISLLNGKTELKWPDTSWSKCISNDKSYIVFKQLLTVQLNDQPNSPKYQKQVIYFG